MEFFKSRSLISNNKSQPKYNNTLAIRGKITNFSEIDNENISLFLGSDFHQVIYPVNQNGDLNFIAIMKYELTLEQQKIILYSKKIPSLEKFQKRFQKKIKNFLIKLRN